MVTYRGRFYQIEDVECLPKPVADGPPILIGGAGERRTLRLVAQYANEWNCVGLTPEAYSHKKAVLEQHCEAVGRDPATVRRSMMTFGIIGHTQEALEQATRTAMEMFSPQRQRTPEEFRERAKARGMIVGRTEEAVDQLGQLADLGVQEVQFQHIDFDSDEMPEYLASEIVPKVAAL